VRLKYVRNIYRKKLRKLQKKLQKTTEKNEENYIYTRQDKTKHTSDCYAILEKMAYVHTQTRSPGLQAIGLKGRTASFKDKTFDLILEENKL
jgi:hypothetical protein